MDLQYIEQFQKQLLNWYDGHARILPWRDQPTPYRVWISEIMLQQTRVDTVKPYFERFTEELPSIKELAEVPEDQLMKLWEGLGYYSRARNLKKAAVMIMDEFGGQLPSSFEELQSLPGIGPYTSGAIASIAFGSRVPAVDGNVLRVISRITANQGDIASSSVKKEIEELVRALLPEQRAGDFNQALMELGATVCLPNGLPKCDQCPVQTLCKGQQLGIATQLPVKQRKKKRRIEEKTVFVIEHKGKIAVRRRNEDGLLSGLWEFPNIEGHLFYAQAERKLREWEIAPAGILPMPNAKHIFTHLEWHMIGYYIQAEQVEENDAFVWATPTQLREQYSIPTAFKAYTAFLKSI